MEMPATAEVGATLGVSTVKGSGAYRRPRAAARVILAPHEFTEVDLPVRRALRVI